MTHGTRLLVPVVLAACTHATPPPSPANTPAQRPRRAPPSASADTPLLDPTCVTNAPRDPAAWDLSGDLLFAAWIDATAPGLPDALERLASYAEDPGHGIAMSAAFALGRLPDEYRFFAAWLAEAGLPPRDLVRAGTVTGAGAWFVPHDCPTDALRSTFEVSLDYTFGPAPRGIVGRPPSDDRIFAVVLLSDGPLVAVPVRQLDAFWAAITAPEMNLHDEPPGDVLADLPPAPVRVVLRQHGFVTRHAPTRLVARPDGVRAGGTVAPP